MPPPKDGSGLQVHEYLEEHVEQWRALEKEHGLQTGRVGNDRSVAMFPYFIMTLMDVDRHMDMSKELKAWGDHAEEIDAKTSWWTVFERYRAARIIP